MRGPIVFVHIPKAGGSTFLSVLRRNFPVSDVLLPDALKSENIAEIERRLPTLENAQSIHGHVPLSLLDRIAGARFATLLRDPVRRQYSHVNWLYGHWQDVPSVAEALAKGRLIDNLQTRMLCGLEEPFTRPADDALLDAALAELDRFAFVGLVERFPESMLLAQERLGLRHVSYFRRNVRGTSHTSDDVDALRAHNELDVELYARTRARIEPELDRLQPRAVALARADQAMSSRRPVADPAAVGYVADFVSSAAVARARRGWARVSPARTGGTLPALPS